MDKKIPVPEIPVGNMLQSVTAHHAVLSQQLFLSTNIYLCDSCIYFHRSQHDELESNLKKIPHRNGIWGLEAIIM